MLRNHPFVLTIAGFDPSAGAGILADIKTLEQLGSYGLGALTCLTRQTEHQFYQLDWLPVADVLENVRLLCTEYPVEALKISVVKDLEQVTKLIQLARHHREKLFICWDPVLRSTTGHDFFADAKPSREQLQTFDLMTPNYQEIDFFRASNESVEACCIRLSYSCAILLKGGHHPNQPGYDSLYENGEVRLLPPDPSVDISAKHGSGCVLSSAICAYKAKGYTLFAACKAAKQYTAQFLASSPNLLGYHHVQ